MQWSLKPVPHYIHSVVGSIQNIQLLPVYKVYSSLYHTYTPVPIYGVITFTPLSWLLHAYTLVAIQFIHQFLYMAYHFTSYLTCYQCYDLVALYTSSCTWRIASRHIFTSYQCYKLVAVYNLYTSPCTWRITSLPVTRVINLWLHTIYTTVPVSLHSLYLPVTSAHCGCY